MADFDPKTMSPKDLKNAPIEVIKTELPMLARALGVSTAELFRALAGGGDPGTELRRPLADCCSSDNW